jgi:hypothetical protein
VDEETEMSGASSIGIPTAIDLLRSPEFPDAPVATGGWVPIEVVVVDEQERTFEFEDDEHLNVWVDRD